MPKTTDITERGLESRICRIPTGVDCEPGAPSKATAAWGICGRSFGSGGYWSKDAAISSLFCALTPLR